MPGFLQTKARILVGPGAKLFVASCECQSVFSTQKTHGATADRWTELANKVSGQPA